MTNFNENSIFKNEDFEIISNIEKKKTENMLDNMSEYSFDISEKDSQN